jgi:N-acetylmuramoyl-L-alanine amidase
MPSVLIELGFLTNPSEEDFLNGDEGQSYLASAIFRAFRTYKETHHPAVAAPAPEEPIELEEPSASEPAPASEMVRYAVQLKASADSISLEEAEFHGLPVVLEYLSDGLYKYATGSFERKEDATELKRELKSGRFPGAFVVAFRGTNPISMREAARATSKARN